MRSPDRSQHTDRFPTDPSQVYATDELRALVRRGMDLGADAIGGAPHLEHSPAGVVGYCAYAHNNNADMFSPYGRMDMLEAGLFALHVADA